MLKSVTFEVVGEQQLHCEGCEQRVERMLKALPGVERVRAQARKQRIEVLYDASTQDPSAIAQHLGTAGYQTNVAISQPR
jgi:copper chaperone